ncbi:MAG TPA: YbjN domain-containing protein [Blastocatellia bacterium]|nr:YbjN domain-containing protein [Blastocatellia bacterium]
MKRIFAVLFLIVCLSLLPIQTIAQASQDKTGPKLVQLLEQSGYKYTKAADKAWTIPFTGKVISDFIAVVTYEEDIVVIFTIVAEKAEYKVTPELMQKLLRMNGDLDRVKIGIDKEGDMFVRIDLSISTLTADELKINANQVASATEQVYEAITPFLVTAKSQKK